MSLYDDARGAVELGALLPETAAARFTGTLRSPKIGTGYEHELSVFLPTGELVPEWAAHARRLAIPTAEYEAFQRGWFRAADGRYRVCIDPTEHRGWDAYPRCKSVAQEHTPLEPYYNDWHDWRGDYL